MKAARTFFLVLALVGFFFSFIVHLLGLWGRTPLASGWLVAPFLGALLSWISAACLSGAKSGRMASIPFKEVVKGCPAWLKRTNYLSDAYVVLIFLRLVLRTSGLFHWKKVELPAGAGFLFMSAVSMTFYVGSFSMLFGKLFGPPPGEPTPG